MYPHFILKSNKGLFFKNPHTTLLLQLWTTIAYLAFGIRTTPRYSHLKCSFSKACVDGGIGRIASVKFLESSLGKSFSSATSVTSTPLTSSSVALAFSKKISGGASSNSLLERPHELFFLVNHCSLLHS